MEHAEEPHRHHITLIAWTVGIVLSIALFVIALLIFLPKPLVVAGTLKTKDGPVPAGTYDFRLKFYNATTRTDVVYTYDAKGVKVDNEGKFSTDLPDAKALNVATLMQVCIASTADNAVPGTIIGSNSTLPSCEVPDEANDVAFNQTICGLTAVDQDPTNTVSWLASKNVVYATPTKACGESAAGIASVSTVDTVAPLLETPGALGELLGGGVSLQPGSLLTIDQSGQLTVETPAEAVSQVVQETVTETLAETPPTTILNTNPVTSTEPGINTQPQTLSISGNVLSISNGNSVTLPTAESDGDNMVGNEITDIIPGDGLMRVGSGTTLDPFRVGLITCANGELLKSSGAAAWGCATDNDTTYSAGNGISFAGNIINNTGVLSFTLPTGGGLMNTGTTQNAVLRLQDCGNGEILQFNGGSWTCVPPGGVSSYSFSITDGVTSEPITNGQTVTFIGNEGLVATVSPTDTVTYGIVNGGVTTVKLADGAITSTKIANGAVTTINLADGAVTNTKLANSNITVTAGSGLSGGGVAALGSGTTLSLQACANGQILKHNGTTWGCATDSDSPQTLSIIANAPDSANTVSYDLSISGGNTVNFDDRDTLYTALTGGGLALASNAFSLQTCPVGQLLKSTNASTPVYVCAVDNDTNTTYSAGSGLSLAGTTFNINVGAGLDVNGSNEIVNSGVLSVGGTGPIASTGGQNPNISFVNGSVAGQFWQWNGSAWVLASLPTEGDGIVGNEVTDVTGANSGLVRSGAGTSVNPYTLAVSVGGGLQLTGGSVAINSPTCNGTDKLQWNGTTFVCSADANTTYSAGNGISLASTTFSVNSPTCAGTTKLQWNGTAFVCSTDIDAQTLSWDGGTRTLSITNGNSIVIPDADTTYSALTNGGLRLVGTQFALKACTTNQILKAQATSGEWDCAADNDTTYSAGTGLSLVGTTFNNTGVLSVTGSGALTSSGGQNPNIAFANGSAVGQFWQWNGSTWVLATLPVDGDSVVGNEITNVTGSNSGLVRSGTGTAVDPYTLAVSVGSGLQVSSGSIAVNSPTCAGTTKLQWNGTAFVCSADIDTTNFSITDGTTTQGVAAAEAITFVGNANTKTTVTLGGTRQLMFGLDTTGATAGQVLTYNGANLAWQSPTTYAPTNCSTTSTYICQNGNTLGAGIVIGSDDAQPLNFETGGVTAMTVLANGNVGIGTTAPAQALHIARTTTDAHMRFTNDNTGHTPTDGVYIGLDLNGGAYLSNFDDRTMHIGINATSQILIAQTTTNVGIHNTAPAVRLHVGSASIATGTTIARFQNAGGTCNIIPSTAGTISCTSDERLKKNIEEYNGALDAVNKLDVKEYNMKTDAQGARKQIGMMAQDLEKVFPGLVSTDENGYKSVAYGGLVPILAQAIQEQQVELDQLKLGVWQGGIVTKDTTFKAATLFEGPAKFMGGASFAGDVTIAGKVKLSKDQVNSVVLPKGRRSVKVTFGGAYSSAPYITVTPQEFLDKQSQYRVTSISKTGFVVEVSQAQSKSIRFDWHAFSR